MGLAGMLLATTFPNAINANNPIENSQQRIEIQTENPVQVYEFPNGLKLKSYENTFFISHQTPYGKSLTAFNPEFKRALHENEMLGEMQISTRKTGEPAFNAYKNMALRFLQTQMHQSSGRQTQIQSYQIPLTQNMECLLTYTGGRNNE